MLFSGEPSENATPERTAAHTSSKPDPLLPPGTPPVSRPDPTPTSGARPAANTRGSVTQPSDEVVFQRIPPFRAPGPYKGLQKNRRPEERELYKEAWVNEFTRRAQVYAQLKPRAGFPDGVKSKLLFNKLYDFAEPRRSGETFDAYEARQSRRIVFERELIAEMGASPENVWGAAGDAQYGGGGPNDPQPPPQ